MISVKPTISILSLTASNTEFTFTLPAWTYDFTIQGDSQIEIRSASGGAGFTVEANSGGYKTKLKSAVTSATFFILTAIAPTTVRIVSWQN